MSEQDAAPNTVQGDEPKPKVPLIDLASIPRPTRSVEVNSFFYTDEKGIKHNIYIPKGTVRVASKLWSEKMFDELGKFPPYTGQGYDNWDNDPETYADFIKSLEQFEYLFERKDNEDDMGLVDPAEDLADQTAGLGVGRT